MGDSAPSIGITNIVYSETDSTECTYKVRLYNNDTEFTPIDEFDFENNGKKFYLNVDGSINVQKDVSVDLLSNDNFKHYIQDNEITKIVIQFGLEENSVKSHDFKLYSINGSPAADNQIEYNLTRTEIVTLTDPETGEPVTDPVSGEILTEEKTILFDPFADPANENFSFSKAEFVSTEMADYEVSVNWHDRGENRPNPVFDVKANDQDYYINGELAENAPVKTVVNSNNDVYTYRVPKYDSNGESINYTSKINTFPDASVYRVEENGDIYDYYGQRTFDFTVDWKDGDSNRSIKQFCNNDSALEQKVLDYINNSSSTVQLSEIQTYIDNVISFIKSNFTLKNSLNPETKTMMSLLICNVLS